MKRLLILVIILGGICAAHGQGWQKVTPTPQPRRLNAVCFTDASRGYAAGDNGTILNTLNGGLTWEAQASATNYTLNSITFTNATTGYIAGGGWIGTPGCMLKTTNSGSHWSSIPTGHVDPLMACYFLQTDTGFAVGLYGSILKTTSAGNAWQDHRVDSVNFLWSVHFPGTATGYAVGMAAGSNGGTILKTTDGGATWSHLTGTTDPLFSVFFINSDTGVAVGNHGTILKTTDGGVNWNAQTTNLTYPYCLYSVCFPAATIGYAVGECGTILKSTDGGTSWKIQTSGIGTNLNAVYFPDPNHGFAVGDNGIILITTSGGDGLKENKLSHAMRIYPLPARDHITVELPDTDPAGTLMILTIGGEEIRRTCLTGPTTNLDIRNLTKGIYLVRYRKDQKTETGKLIVE